jgi:hypothetical protein
MNQTLILIGHFVMQRKELLGIKRRAEATPARNPDGQQAQAPNSP